MNSASNLEALPGKVTVTYAIDPSASRFNLHVTASGWLSVFGHNLDIAIRRYEGEIQVDSVSIDRSSLVLRIDAASLEVVSKTSDQDRRDIERIMRDEVLLAREYPEIIYECSQVKVSAMSNDRYWMALNGELTLRGMTRPQSVSPIVTLNNSRLGASGELSVLQTQFGIKPISTMGGGLVVKDELKFKFDIVAHKK